MSIETNTSNTAAVLKGGVYTLSVLQLLSNDWDVLAHQLDEKIKQAPHFFHYAPLILDVHRLVQGGLPIDFARLVPLLRAKKLIAIGVRGLTAALKPEAIEVGLAIFPDETPKRTAPSKTDPTPETPSLGSRVITQPVRSGQQIYIPEGDLIILSSVSHGAEVLAEGNIHIYGTLRGRALAGITGNADAMIICKSLEAELVSIAGQYRLSDDLKSMGWQQSVCVQLKERRLHITSI